MLSEILATIQAAIVILAAIVVVISASAFALGLVAAALLQCLNQTVFRGGRK